MTRIAALPPPETSLLAQRRGEDWYRDAFRACVPGHVTLGTFVTEFFAGPAFLPERMALHLIGRGAGAAEIAALAEGTATRFAAWEMEAREADQLLMHDFLDRTCCWLAVSHEGDASDLGAPHNAGEREQRFLWFGTGLRNPGGPFARWLKQPHRAYARWLLAGAARRLR